MLAMHTKLPISVFIITCNEADRLATTINSVKDWVDEVIVVDSGSSDNTLEVAAAHGAQISTHSWQGYGPQKRFAEELCKNTWLLNLDADEEVTPKLRDEIMTLFENATPKEAGFKLRIRDMLPGEKKLSRFAHTNFVLRLYNKEQGRFSTSPVHDSVLIEQGTVQTLKAPVLHRSYRSWEHVIQKINSYTTMQAQNMMQSKPKRFVLFRMMIEWEFAFFKDYILRGYIFRGRRGFVNSVFYASGRLLRLAKYQELKEKEPS